MSAQLAVERATGSAVEHLESVLVVETVRGKTLWQGIVDVFRVLKPPPEWAYGWAVEGNKEPQYVAVLGNPPVDSPIAAVRAWLVSERKKTSAPLISNGDTTGSLRCTPAMAAGVENTHLTVENLIEFAA